MAISGRKFIGASALALGISIAAPAAAQDDNAASDESITVTGSRLENVASSEPITIITAEDIETRGITNIQQLLRQVSSNNTNISSSNPGGINGGIARNRGNVVRNLSGGSSIDLRGIGAGATLVLVNGRRFAGEGSANNDFADVSAIPVEAIERVEILTAGASAIYGADAIAGVVNIILNKNYNGARLSIRQEFSDSGADSVKISGSVGQGWGSGNITVSASYEDTKAVDARKFGVSTRDFRPQGGTDRRRFGSTRGLFQVSPFSLAGLDPADPFASNLFVLPVNSGGIDDFTDPDGFELISRDQFGASVGEILPIALSPDEETYAISARLTQDVNAGPIDDVFLDVLYTKRKTSTVVETPLFFLESFDIADGSFGLPFFDDDSFSGFREDLEFALNLSEIVAAGIIPNNNFETDSENITFSGGVNGHFTDDWTWELNGNYSLNEDTDFSRSLDFFGVYFGTFDEETFEEINPPFNLVRSDFLTNPDAAAALARAVQNEITSGRTELWSAQAIGRGKLFNGRGAGPLQIAYGGEYREERINSSEIAVSESFSGPAVTIPDLDATRTTTAFFAEASFPIITSLTVNGALRYEEISNNGTTVGAADALQAFVDTGEPQFDPIDVFTPFDQSDNDVTWRVGAAWDVIDDLTLRVSRGTSFRAPNAFEVGAPSIAFFYDEFGILDPATGEEVDPDTTVISGGNLNLQSETADTLNVGFAFSPTFGGHRFSLDVDYFEIKFKDRIGNSSNFIGSGLFDQPLEELAISRAPDGSIDFLISQPINIARQERAGIDVNFSHGKDFGNVSIETILGYTLSLKDEVQDIAGGEITDDLGISQPETRWNLATTVEVGDFRVTGVYTRTGSYELRSGADISSFGVFDLTASYRFPDHAAFLENWRLTAGARNLFNQDPPFVDSANGFVAQSYDTRRQVFFAELSASF